MSHLVVIMFAWFFLVQEKGGGLAPSIHMMVGPFETQEECQDINEWVRDDVKKLTRCWRGTFDEESSPSQVPLLQ